MTECNKLRKALKKFKTMGYIVKRKNYTGDWPDKFIMLADWNYDMFHSDGDAQQDSYVYWRGDVDEILEVFHRCGIEAEWCGKEKTSIKIF